jgi:hypothetical protein
LIIFYYGSYPFQEKAQETLDFTMSEVGRMDSERHSLVLKEVLSLISKYPYLLTLAVINKVSMF